MSQDTVQDGVLDTFMNGRQKGQNRVLWLGIDECLFEAVDAIYGSGWGGERRPGGGGSGGVSKCQKDFYFNYICMCV